MSPKTGISGKVVALLLILTLGSIAIIYTINPSFIDFESVNERLEENRAEREQARLEREQERLNRQYEKIDLDKLRENRTQEDPEPHIPLEVRIALDKLDECEYSCHYSHYRDIMCWLDIVHGIKGCKDTGDNNKVVYYEEL